MNTLSADPPTGHAGFALLAKAFLAQTLREGKGAACANNLSLREITTAVPFAPRPLRHRDLHKPPGRGKTLGLQ